MLSEMKRMRSSICHRFLLLRSPDPQTTGMQVHKTHAVSGEAYFCPAGGSDMQIAFRVGFRDSQKIHEVNILENVFRVRVTFSQHW